MLLASTFTGNAAAAAFFFFAAAAAAAAAAPAGAREGDLCDGDWLALSCVSAVRTCPPLGLAGATPLLLLPPRPLSSSSSSSSSMVSTAPREEVQDQ